MKKNLHDKVERRADRKINLLVVGLFFLVWSVNGFFIGGNTVKMFLLLSGFALIIATSFNFLKDIKFIKFVVFTLVMLLSFWFIAYIQDQYTLKTSIIVFDMICYLLLLCGYLMGRNIQRFGKLNNRVILLLSVLTILGVFMYVKFQSVLELSATQTNRAVIEEGDDNVINVIGIAYTNAIIFFVLYHILTTYKPRGWLRTTVFFSMIATFFLIFSTQSRGAIIYIILILLLDNFYRFTALKNIFKIILSVIFITFFTLALYIQVIDSFPVLGDKMEGALSRFASLQKLTDNVQADQSSYERTLLIQDFYSNIGSIIVFGQQKYTPYPHNQFLEIIMRWGIFFGLPVLIFSVLNFLKSLQILLKRITFSPLLNLIVLLFLFSFLQSMSSMSLEMNRILWLGLGFLAGLPRLVTLIKLKQTK
ncbi:MAG: hypothetical protein ABIQ31_22795 [Ferruginibacter sp.]